MTTSDIPEQITRLPQWVVWQYETRNGKPTKVPYVPGTNRKASSTNKSDWRSYEEALADKTKPGGPGFVFSADDPYVGIDLDDCLEAGKVKTWAQELLDLLPDTYTEISPSGTGLKLWVSGEIPARGKHRIEIADGEVEVYERGRFFTVTGDRYTESMGIAQADLKPMYARLWPDRRSIPPPAETQQSGGYDGSNEEMIQAIRRSKSAPLFNQLWSGDITGYGDDHSRADQALLNILAWWCGPHPKRIDTIFRQSGLYREKWDRDTYRDTTIKTAIDGQSSFYQPRTSVQVNESCEAVSKAKAGHPYDMTEIGNAERMADYYRDRIRHCEKVGGWYLYDGKRWVRDDMNRIFYYAIRMQKAMWREWEVLDGDTREAMQKHITASATHGRLSSALKLCASLPDVSVTHEEFDADPWLFNCKDGTIDLRTGALRSHNPADGITKYAGCGYHPGATCSRWMRFLERIFNGNQELMDYVQEIAGMCLTGDVSEQVMPVFFGHGSNGKSTLLDTLMMVMGDYAGNAAPDLLVARTGESHPTEVADLWGLRLAVASEPDEGAKLRIGLLKRMTGDAKLKARYMRGDFFDFERTHKMIYVTNHKPRVGESSDGIWRRLRLVEFAARIEDAEKDKQLMQKLAAEKMGILAWAVKGCLRWQRNGGLSDPADVIEATRSYREDEDVLADFVSSRLVLDPDGWVLLKDVRRVYSEYCRAEEVQYPLGERALFSRIAERPGVKKVKRNDGRGFLGLKFAGG